MHFDHIRSPGAGRLAHYSETTLVTLEIAHDPETMTLAFCRNRPWRVGDAHRPRWHAARWQSVVTPDEPKHNEDTGFYEYREGRPQGPDEQGRRQDDRGGAGGEVRGPGSARLFPPPPNCEKARRRDAGGLFRASGPSWRALRRGSAPRSTSFFEPRITDTRWCSLSGWISRMRPVPSMAALPACSTIRPIGLASYIRRSLPALPGLRASQGT